ncbi:hypothetical protein [Pontibacter rugosus]|uniref:Uncharacterized protein n=1 Tax=Pontibacter rugosus TaxID=1745966 RepID=A0ABW3SJP3_9BACT
MERLNPSPIARFYDARGILVWECKKDAKYELANGSKAINKGAASGVLLVAGQQIDSLTYNTSK